jgi:outer membrane receptor protein involved in Fe transport
MANDKLIGAMKLAIAGTGAASGLVPLEAALAQQQAPPAPTAQPVTTLEEITVTGTHIRRVDAETASPVFVVDQKSIESTGAVTLGDLISRMPAISGSAQSTAVNNGGGFGESNIDLRGLGNPSQYTEPRTLIMLDGRRVNLIGSSNAVDVNQFPINMIERVEVLKEGAGAIYGSDAIAGVVNFITRKVEGFEVNADYGRTSKSDGQHHSLSVAFGHSDETMSFVVGGNYNQQDSVSAGARDYSKYALYFYSGAVAKRGSSRTPNGRIGLPDPTNPLYTPAQAAAAAAMVAAFPGCSSITRIAGAVGSSLADYRCYSSATDSYNFQPLNLLLTPQERGSIFTKVNYKLSENLEAYGEVLFNRTHSGYQLAPLPFDITNDNVIVSAQNLYNPFGVDFGGLSGVNPNARWRLTAVGDRRSDDTGESVMSWLGMRGKIADTGWQWDANVNYSRLDQNRTASGYLNESALGNALGPSKLINGVPTCVDSSGNPIAAVCTPADIFNLSGPGQAAGLQGIAADVNSQNTSRTYSFNLDLNGKVMTLPSGDMLASVGADYVGLAGKYQIDSNAIRVPPLYLSCGVSSEECSGNSRAHYGVRELYGELFVPVLKDLPAVKSLNLDAGVRYSSYTIFGSTTKGQIKLRCSGRRRSPTSPRRRCRTRRPSRTPAPD